VDIEATLRELLAVEHADQIFAMMDDIAERARKLGGSTLRSIGDIARTSD
jgi:starvation-inducible DNA-binding protein